jgi:hypothetical protein
MAKINLLTIHYGKCYGAVMQTYATCRLLEKAGHTVRVINLIHPNKKDIWKQISFWKDCVREFQFWLFKKRFFSKMTNKAYSISDINLPIADITIVGSDQVWNRDITGVFGMSFYLDFVDGNQSKIALSSSFGKEVWDESADYTEKVKKLFCQFKAISIRESTGVTIMQDIFRLPSVNLPDPTLGYGHFEDLVLNLKPVKQIFPFLLLNDETAQLKAAHIAKKIGLPLFKHSNLTVRFLNGPRHWLTRIKNSEYVITDSFHGLALSLLFKKQFFIFCASEKKFTRLRSLLSLLSLEDRFVESIDDFDKRKSSLLRPIDYNKVDAILENERKRYYNFIRNNI